MTRISYAIITARLAVQVSIRFVHDFPAVLYNSITIETVNAYHAGIVNIQTNASIHGPYSVLTVYNIRTKEV